MTLYIGSSRNRKLTATDMKASIKSSRPLPQNSSMIIKNIHSYIFTISRSAILIIMCVKRWFKLNFGFTCRLLLCSLHSQKCKIFRLHFWSCRVFLNLLTLLLNPLDTLQIFIFEFKNYVIFQMKGTHQYVWIYKFIAVNLIPWDRKWVISSPSNLTVRSQ